MDKFNKIFFALITLAILIAVGFYSWSVWEKQKYFKKQGSINQCETKCKKEWIKFPELSKEKLEVGATVWRYYPEHYPNSEKDFLSQEECIDYCLEIGLK